MTRTLLETAGHPSEADVQAFREVGFTDEQVLEILLAISVKTISNWTNHLFGTEVAYDRTVDGQVLDFGVSGSLFQSAMVVYDRQTESLWDPCGWPIGGG